MKKTVADYWKAIGLLFPKHRMGGIWHGMYKGTYAYCTDDEPSGWGGFGCRRCQAIVDLEKRGIKIYPKKVEK